MRWEGGAYVRDTLSGAQARVRCVFFRPYSWSTHVHVSLRMGAQYEGLPGHCPPAHVRAWWQVDHAIQFGEDADVKIRDLGMGELGGDDI